VWWGYLISLFLPSLSAGLSARLLPRQLRSNSCFSSSCQRRAGQDGAGGRWAGRCRLCLPTAAGAAPLCTRESWGASAGVCQCWQRSSAGENKLLLEVSLGPACLKNDNLFKIGRIGANSALILEHFYPSEDYQKPKLRAKA